MVTSRCFWLLTRPCFRSYHEPAVLPLDAYVTLTLQSCSCWDLAKFQHMFNSPQVKQNLISIMKICVYKLPHKLLIDLRLRISWDYKNYKMGWGHSLVRSLPLINECLALAVKIYTKIDIIFWSCSIALDFFSFSKYIKQKIVASNCRVKRNYFYIRDTNS